MKNELKSVWTLKVIGWAETPMFLDNNDRLKVNRNFIFEWILNILKVETASVMGNTLQFLYLYLKFFQVQCNFNDAIFFPISK